jgi:zinc transporter
MSLQPNSAYINDGFGADRGLICGYQLSSVGLPREVMPEAVADALTRREAVTWLHFNLSDARARRWLLESPSVPESYREVLREHDENRRVEYADDGVLMVVSDFSYEHDSDPSEGAPLWCFADKHVLLTARVRAAKSADDLRLAMRADVTVTSGFELAAYLLELRTDRLQKLASDMVARLDDIEDEILAGSIKQQREQLGKMRRWCARSRRRFAPERTDMGRLLALAPATFAETDRDAFKAATDALGFAIEEVLEVYERAKLLQEELASRLAENTGRNLYVLSILTAVLLPMTLVTGVFGMNVAGMPGLRDPGAFFWIVLLILASGATTLAMLFWRRLL